jgi:dihydrolipoamide dehydrogenase
MQDPQPLDPFLGPQNRVQTLDRPAQRTLGQASTLARQAPEERPQPMASSDGAYDVAIIGSGPGGYVAAIRAGQLGLRTALIERGYLGGTCLNVGCIPTKAMLGSVAALETARRGREFGFVASEVTPDYAGMVKRRDRIVEQLRGGVGQLLKGAGVTVLQGTGRIVSPTEVEVAREGGADRVHARHLLLATGSVPARAPIPGADLSGVVVSDDLMALTDVPASMVVIGAGAVGLEWGDIYRGLGTEVTVLEMMPQVLPSADAETAAEMQKSLSRKGIRVHVGARVEKIDRGGAGLAVQFTTEKGGQTVEAQYVLLATGRRAYTEGLGLEAIGLETQRGVIPVDDRMRTAVANVYAIGDCIGNYMLAHVASKEGEIAVENIAGHEARMDYRAVPSCVYTHPEVAMVGLTEEEARERHDDVRVGRFPFRILGKALAAGEREGFVKIISDDRYGEILGVHMIGSHVTDLIAEAVLAMQMEGTVEDLFHAIHAHPTLPEAVMEASLDVLGRSIHKG